MADDFDNPRPENEKPNEGDRVRAEVDEAVQTFLAKLNELATRGYTINFKIGPTGQNGAIVLSDVQVLKAI